MAQSLPFPAMQQLDINNIKANVLVHGDMWWNPASEVASCEFPIGSGKNISFTGSLWMSGYDGGGQLHIAAQTYRQIGNDYWPGPLNSSDTLTYSTSHDWANIWKINRTDVDSFLRIATRTTANIPPVILAWPGTGNTYATGNAGAALTVTGPMAPFKDLNSNGIYEPLLGEYPDFPGDQALWWVFSDNGPTHTETKGMPLGVEVHAMSFGYNRGTTIDNVVYYKYEIINKSSNTYTNFRMSQFADMDLGYFDDDFIGFDSTWRLGITYNGVPADGQSAGFPVNSYNTSVPVAGVTMVVLPGDAAGSYVPAGSFDYYDNDTSMLIGNPDTAYQYNNYMRAKLRNGGNYTRDFAGPGTPSYGYGTGPVVNYVYDGNPTDSSKWSECVSGNIPGDRRFIISTNDFTLNLGEVKTVVMALVTTNEGAGQACASGVDFSGIKTVADTAWAVYFNPPAPLATTAITGGNSKLSIFPNPAGNELWIEQPANLAGDASIIIYNTFGQSLNLEVTHEKGMEKLDIASLPVGCYYVMYTIGQRQFTASFIKE